jgi:hypothetical protein
MTDKNTLNEMEIEEMEEVIAPGVTMSE